MVESRLKADRARIERVPNGDGADLLVMYPWSWSSNGKRRPAVVELRDVEETGGTVTCELRVLLVLKDDTKLHDASMVLSAAKDPGRADEFSLIHAGAFKLGDLHARRQMARHLADQGLAGDWANRLEYILDVARKECLPVPPRPVELKPYRGDDTPFVFIPGLMPRGETTLLYGMGGAGKSLTSLAIALGVAGVKVKLPGMEFPVKARTLYLDFESSNVLDHGRRLSWLLRGFNLPDDAAKGHLFYMPMFGGLADQVRDIERYAREFKTEFIIIDSAGLAAGGAVESSEIANAVTGALRRLHGATRLLIAHVTKADQKAGEGHRAQPIGSVYWRNSVRSAIELNVLGHEDGELTVKFRQDKYNMGAPSDTFAWTYLFNRDLQDAEGAIESITVAEATPALTEGTLQNAIANALPMPPMFWPVSAILASLARTEFQDRTAADVRSALSELHKKGFARPKSTEKERNGRPQEWAKNLPSDVDF